MLIEKQKLNPQIFSEDVEKKSTRDGFGQGLLEIAEKDERIVGLCADLTGSTKMDNFAKKFPERFVEVGVAEQNLASVASGMASMGKIPFISSYAIFSPGRNWEQIRTTICYNDVPVKIVGSHAGVSVGPDGGTHQALEDIAITRVIPNLVVISPCDYLETKKAIIAMAFNKKPTYIRLAREKSPVITTEETPFEIGKSKIFYQSNGGKSDVGIIATGPLLYNALLATKELETKKIKVTVMNLSTIKPLDEKSIINLAHETRAIVTVEEHQIVGGMGSTVSECLAKNLPTIQEFVGVKDLFGQSGTASELIEHYGMGKSHIMEAVYKAILRK